MYDGLPKIISSVLSNRDSWPFREAVNEKMAPLYYEVIQNPIDLSIMKKKIDDRLYVDFSEVEKDFKLLINNCETYNGPGNGYTLLSYTIWRVFKRAVKRFLNLDLSYDDQTAFIYPPPTRLNGAPKAAIEARRKRRKHRKLKALETLARAAEEAVRITTIRGTSTDILSNLSPLSSSSPSSSSKENDQDFDPTDSVNTHFLDGPIARILPLDNSPEVLQVLTNANLNIGLSVENLTFKSLSEWSEFIRDSGEIIKLPQNSVILSANSTPNSKSNFPQTKLSEERHTKSLSLDRLKIDKPNSHAQLSSQDDGNSNAHQSTNTDDDSRTSGQDSTTCQSPSNSCDINSNESSPNSENKRLVLKLCRSSGPVWKAIKLANNDGQLSEDLGAKDSSVIEKQLSSHRETQISSDEMKQQV